MEGYPVGYGVIHVLDLVRGEQAADPRETKRIVTHKSGQGGGGDVELCTAESIIDFVFGLKTCGDERLWVDGRQSGRGRKR